MKSFTGTDYLMIETIGEAMNFTVQVLHSENWAEVIPLLFITIENKIYSRYNLTTFWPRDRMASLTNEDILI